MAAARESSLAWRKGPFASPADTERLMALPLLSQRREELKTLLKMSTKKSSSSAKTPSSGAEADRGATSEAEYVAGCLLEYYAMSVEHARAVFTRSQTQSAFLSLQHDLLYMVRSGASRTAVVAACARALQKNTAPIPAAGRVVMGENAATRLSSVPTASSSSSSSSSGFCRDSDPNSNSNPASHTKERHPLVDEDGRVYDFYAHEAALASAYAVQGVVAHFSLFATVMGGGGRIGTNDSSSSYSSFSSRPADNNTRSGGASSSKKKAKAKTSSLKQPPSTSATPAATTTSATATPTIMTDVGKKTPISCVAPPGAEAAERGTVGFSQELQLESPPHLNALEESVSNEEWSRLIDPDRICDSAVDGSEGVGTTENAPLLSPETIRRVTREVTERVLAEARARASAQLDDSLRPVDQRLTALSG